MSKPRIVRKGGLWHCVSPDSMGLVGATGTTPFDAYRYWILFRFGGKFTGLAK